MAVFAALSLFLQGFRVAVMIQVWLGAGASRRSCPSSDARVSGKLRESNAAIRPPLRPSSSREEQTLSWDRQHDRNGNSPSLGETGG
jgi:hypothetical protein